MVGVVAGLPALRLRGPYLLLATLGVYFISQLVWKEFLVHNFGFGGMQVPRPQLPTWTAGLPLIGTDTGQGMVIDSNLRWYLLLLPICGVIMLFLSNLARSRVGRSFAAVRERDVSAALLGINVARTKLVAFAVSSAVVSIAGALSSYFLGARGEDSFPIQITLNFAIMIVVGGFSSIQGAIFGALFFVAMPELTSWARGELPILRDSDFLQKNAGAIDLLIFGALVVLVLVNKPDGLAGIWRDVKGWVRAMAVHDLSAVTASSPTAEGGLEIRGVEVPTATSSPSAVCRCTFPRGFVSVLGANGAGKTTLVRAITGLLPLHRGRIVAGTITLDGRHLETLSSRERVRAGSPRCPRDASCSPTSPWRRTCCAGGHAWRPAAIQRGHRPDLRAVPRLAERRKQTAGYLSGGEQQMVAVGRGPDGQADVPGV